MEVRRIGPDQGFISKIVELEETVRSLQTRPFGTYEDTDEETGSSTVIGVLPDGSVGIDTFVNDTIPPEQPSAPIVTVANSLLAVSWDGKDVNGGDPPKDYKKTLVEMAPNGSNVWIAVDELRGNSVVYVSGLPYDEPTFFRLVSVDTNNNRSEPSDAASGTPQPLVESPDIFEALQDINDDILTAQQAAQTAQGAAQAAQDAADQAIQDALEASTLAGTKGTVYTQSITPADDPNGLWIDTGHSNTPRRYLGTGRKALYVNYSQGSSVGPRLTATGWDVTTVTATPTLAEATTGYDLVAFDIGYAALGTDAKTLAAQLFEKGISIYTSGNDTTSLTPLFTGTASRGTPKNPIRPSGTGPLGTGWSQYSDNDLNFYLTGVNASAVVTAVSLITGSVDQPINVVMEHPTNFARWVHIETYATPSAVIDLHLNWIADNWVAVRDQTVVDAVATAQTKADQAFNNAATAATAAGTAQTTANGKARVWYQDDAPAGTGHNVNDVWFDTNDGNKPHRWSGAAWVSAQDQAIVAAQTTANNAYSVANGKNTTYYQTSQPSGGSYIQGDLWFDTDNNYKLHTYTGSIWQATQDSAAAKAEAIAAAATDATSKANAAQAAAEAAAAADAAQKAAEAEANAIAAAEIDAQAKADAAEAAAITAAEQEAEAARIAAINAAAADATAKVATKNKSYYQPAQPSGGTYLQGDLWFDTDANYKLYTYSGSAWVATQDAAAAKSEAISAAATDATSKANAAQAAAIAAAALDATAKADAAKAAADRAAMQTVNKLVNPSFEPDLGNWTPGRAVLDSTTARSGTKSARVDGGTGTRMTPQPVTTPVVPGQKWRIGVWYKTTSDYNGTAGNGKLRWGDQTDVHIQSATFLPNKTDWTWIEIERTIGSAETAISPTLNSDHTVGKIWFDEVEVRDVTELRALEALAAQAETDAIAAAALDATTKANNAKAAAEATAAADATAKANTAKAEAINAAAIDATNKVATKNKSYYQPAEPTGGTYLQGDLWFDTDNNYKLHTYSGSAWVGTQDAAAAQAAAIAAAATDATTKADAAKAAAEAAAAITAQNKADAAQAAAIAAAATDATNKVATKNKSYYQPAEPTGGTYLQGDLWFDTDNNYKLHTYSGSAWVGTQDAAAAQAAAIAAAATDATTKANNAQTAAINTAQAEIDRIWAASRSYINEATSAADIQVMNGVTPTVVTSTTAMAGKALQKTGTGNGWWHDNQAKQAVDPTALYRFSIRVRVVTPQNNGGGKGLYWGAAGLAADGTTFVNATGANSYSSQQWVQNNTQVPTDGAWYDYVGYYKGISASTPTGSGTVLNPKTFHADTRYIVPSMLLDYSAGNGTWEVSHWSVDVIDAAGHQALVDASNKSATYYQTTKPSGGTYKIGDVWFDTDDGNKIYVHNGTDFVVSQDAAIATAQGTANTALTAANGKNKVIWSTSAASGTTGYATGDVWFQTSGGSVIAQWEFTTSWQSRTLAESVIGNLSAGKITSGTIDANRIGANSISANKLFVGDMTNLAADGNFTDLTKANWGGSGTIVQTANEPNRLRVVTAASGNNDQPNNNSFQVTAGEKIYGEVWVYGEAANVGGGGPNMHLTVASHTGSTSWPTFQSLTRAAVSGQWVLLKGVVTVPANSKSAKVELAASYSADAVGNIYYFREVSVRRMATGNLIVDGAITAGSAIIANGAIANAQIGDLNAGKINAGTLDAARLNAEDIKAKLIEASYINATDIFAANSITSASGIFGTMDASVINSGLINAARLDAETIRTKVIDATNINAADIIATGSITSASGVFGTVDAAVLNTGTLNADRLNANDIRAKVISAPEINAVDIIAAGTLTSASGVFGTMDASVINAGTLSADRIGANTISASKIAVADFNNLFDNGRFDLGTDGLLGWNSGDGTVVADAAAPSGKALRVDGVTGAYPSRYQTRDIPFAEGEKVRVKALVKRSATANSVPSVRTQFLNSSKAMIANYGVGATVPAADTWGPLNGVTTAPAGTAYVRLWVEYSGLSGSYGYVTSIEAYRMNAGELIVDGTIKAGSAIIEDGAITNAKIGSLDATKITTGTLDAARLNAEDIRAKVIAATNIDAVDIIAANSLTSASGVFGTMNASVINAGTFSADRIGANSISTSKLIVADMEELIPNPFFHPSGEPIVAGQGTILAKTAPEVPAGAPYDNVIKLTQRDTSPFATPNIAVRPGDQFYMEAMVAASPTTTRNFNFYIFGGNAPVGSLSAKFASGRAPITTWTPVQWSFTVPTNATYTYIKPYLQVETVGGDTSDKWIWYVTGWTMRRKNRGELIVDGAIQAGSAIIGTGAISTAQIGSLDAAKITSGTIDANRIAADSISVSKLKVTSLDNLISSPTFLNNPTDSWPLGSGMSFDATGARNGGPALKIVNSATQQGSYNAPAITTEPLQSYRLTAWVKSDVAIPVNGLALYMRTAPSSGVTTAAVVANSPSIAANTWTPITGVAKMLTDTRTVQFGVYSQSSFSTGNVWVDFVSATRMASGELIVDGAIKANSAIIENGAISSAQINDLNAAKITAGTLDAARLNAADIRAKLIEADYLSATDIFAANSITSASGIFGTMDASVLNAGTIAAARLDAETIKSKLIDASLINAADIIATGSITSTNGLIGSLDAGVITAGTLSASRIGSKAITADKLAVTSTDNLITEADFGNGGASWQMGTWKAIDATGGRGGTAAMKFGPGYMFEITTVNFNNKFTVEDDNHFYGKFSVKAVNGNIPVGYVDLRLRCFTDGTSTPVDPDILVATNDVEIVAGSWYTFEGISPNLPTGTIYAEAVISVTPGNTAYYVLIDSVSLTRAGEGKLIVDGSIVTENLAAGAITADKIDANAVTADKLSATAIDGKSITGVTITGGELKTAGDAQTGVRAQIGQYMVNDAAGTDRPGFGFVKPDNSISGVGMFSEDGEVLTVMGSRLTGSAPDSYIRFSTDEIYIYNSRKITLRTDSFMNGGVNIENTYVNIRYFEKDKFLVAGRRADTTGWWDLSLAGNWVSYTGGGGYYQGLRYRREGESIRIQGMVKNASGGAGTTIATLPAFNTTLAPSQGYPDVTGLYLCAAGTLAAPRQVAYVVVNNTGTIVYDTGPASPTFVSIDVLVPLEPLA